MNDGKKKKPQKHQNKTAFKIQFNPLALDIHKKVSFKGLCKRCIEQIQWKINYNKYKKMAEPAKCNYCHQKNIFRTYMKACESCYQKENVCPKCLQNIDPEEFSVKLNEKQQRQKNQSSQQKMNSFIKTLKQRSRRTVKRLLYEKGTIQWDDQLNNFVDQDGNPLVLQFRQGYGDKSSLNDESSCMDQIDEDQAEGQNGDWQDIQDDNEDDQHDEDDAGDNQDDLQDLNENGSDQEEDDKDQHKKVKKSKPTKHNISSKPKRSRK